MKSMKTFYEDGKNRKARICNVCGKEGSMNVIMNHIEAHHIAGMSVPSDPCGKVFKDRAALKHHNFRHHRNK